MLSSSPNAGPLAVSEVFRRVSIVVHPRFFAVQNVATVNGNTTLLVVDDDKVVTQLLNRWLTQEGGRLGEKRRKTRKK